MEVNFQQVKQYAEQKGIDFQTAAKQLGLTAQEAKALESIGGDPGKNEDGFVSTRKKTRPQESKKKEESFFSKLGVASAVVAGFTVAGAVIGGVLGFFGGAGAGAAPGAIGGAKAGALAGALLVGATSCSSEMKQEMTYVHVTKESSNDEIIAAMIEKWGQNIIWALRDLKEEVKLDTERIITILQGMNFTLDKIYTELLNQGLKGDEILVAINKNTEEQNVRLDALARGNEDIKKLLKDILTAINNGNDIAKNNNEILTEVLKQLASIKDDNAAAVNLLKEILAKVTEGVQQDKDMNEQTQTLLKAILSGLENFNTDNTTLLKEIIERIGKFDEKTQVALQTIIAGLGKLGDTGNALLNKILNEVIQNNKITMENQDVLIKILEKLDKFGENGKAALEELLNAIKENTTVAKGTYELVKALLDKVDKLGAKADTIIEVIGKIGTGQNVDLSKIEEMLAALLEQEKANQKIFTDINSKLNLISVTLQSFADQIDANNKAVLAKLQEILDKIPDGCKCTHETLDITVLLEKLDKIIEEIKKDPKNEGILGDLGELENMLG